MSWLLLALLLRTVAAETLPPFPLSTSEAQSLLQGFTDVAYRRGFRHIGDRRDFDHGHLLLDPAAKPRAILYHTQELGRYETGDFATFDLASRNWLQWVDSGVVEKADRYERELYPSTGPWRAFVLSELPDLKAHRTIVDRMLDPERLGFTVAASVQWVFTRRACADGLIRLRVEGGTTACLELTVSPARAVGP